MTVSEKIYVMVTKAAFLKMVLSFPEVKELPHFEKTSFGIRGRIFATYDDKTKKVCIKLSEADQDELSTFDATVIYPVPNKWGKQGWTLVELTSVRRKMLIDALTLGYCEVAPKKLSKLVKRPAG